MGSVISQIGAAFNSPIGMTVLAIAVLAVAGILLWAFWGRNDVATKVSPTGHPARIVPPPVLAPTVFTGGASAVTPKEYTLRNVILGTLGVLATVIALGAVMSRDRMAASAYHYAHADEFATQAGYEPATAENGYVTASFGAPRPGSTSAVAALNDPMCSEGFTDIDSRSGYQLCAEGQAARFDVISFEKNGVMLLNAAWNEKSGFTAIADNMPAPFGFDQHVSMVAAAGASVNGYDAYVAIGLSDGTLSKDADPVRVSAERAYSLGRYTLGALRGESDFDCRSRAVVYSLSVGTAPATQKDMVVRPVLLGVDFDDRYPAADRDVGVAINAFLRSRGTQITGYNLSEYGPREYLFAEKACPKFE